MSVQQISVFLESQPGHLRRVLDAFEDAHVSVRGYSASDTGDYGIVRFIVDDPLRALDVLVDMGAAATTTDVLCARLNDEPGELARFFSEELVIRDMEDLIREMNAQLKRPQDMSADDYNLVFESVVAMQKELAAAKLAHKPFGIE